MNFVEGIAPLADWPKAGQWRATRQAEEMVQAFIAAAKAAPDPGDGADPDELLKSLLSAVQAQFPGATEQHSDRMLAKLMRRKWLKSI